MTKFLLLQRKIAHIKINFTLIIRFSPGISICLTDAIILPDIKYVLNYYILYLYTRLPVFPPVWFQVLLADFSRTPVQLMISSCNEVHIG